MIAPVIDIPTITIPVERYVELVIAESELKAIYTRCSEDTPFATGDLVVSLLDAFHHDEYFLSQEELQKKLQEAPDAE